MIDEKRLLEKIDRMNDTVSLYRQDVRTVAQNLLCEISDYIKEQPEIRWIPCREQLPEESLNAVIGWDEYRKRCCFVQYYSGRWNLGDNCEPVKITAWQPVPEAYKGKDD